MAQQVRNVTNIIINDRVAALSAGSVDTLNAGEIGVFAADGTRMTTVAAATATSFFLAISFNVKCISCLCSAVFPWLECVASLTPSLELVPLT